MPERFAINGKPASAEDFDFVQDNLCQLGRAEASLISDGNLDRAELTSAFDGNQDGLLTYRELSRYKIQLGKGRFEQWTDLFARHGFNPYENLTDLGPTMDRLKKRPNPWVGFAPPAPWDDRAFLKVALASDGEMLQWAEPRYRDDPELVLIALQSYSSALDYASARLRYDKAFILKAVRLRAWSFAGLPELLRRDETVALAAVQTYGEMLGSVSGNLRKNKNVVLAAVQNHGLALRFASEELRQDKSIAFAAVLNDGLAIRYVAAEWQSNKYLLQTALHSNPIALLYVDDATLPEGFVAQFLSEIGITLPSDLGTFPQSELLQELRSITDYPERFTSLATIVTLWENRRRRGFDLPDSRPVALLIYNRNDGNGAFTQSALPDKIVQAGVHNVLYFEASNEMEIEAILRSVTANGKRPVQNLVLAGHGRQKGINFDLKYRNENLLTGEKKDFDVSDLRFGNFRQLRRYLASEGQVLLYACSTAQGGESANNLANAVADRVPKGVQVLAARNLSQISDVAVAADGRLKITWDARPYETHGRFGVKKWQGHACYSGVGNPCSSESK